MTPTLPATGKHRQISIDTPGAKCYTHKDNLACVWCLCAPRQRLKRESGENPEQPEPLLYLPTRKHRRLGNGSHCSPGSEKAAFANEA